MLLFCRPKPTALPVLPGVGMPGLQSLFGAGALLSPSLPALAQAASTSEVLSAIQQLFSIGFFSFEFTSLRCSSWTQCTLCIVKYSSHAFIFSDPRVRVYCSLRIARAKFLQSQSF